MQGCWVTGYVKACFDLAGYFVRGLPETTLSAKLSIQMEHCTCLLFLPCFDQVREVVALRPGVILLLLVSECTI